jgi:hypothetical protein
VTPGVDPIRGSSAGRVMGVEPEGGGADSIMLRAVYWGSVRMSAGLRMGPAEGGCAHQWASKRGEGDGIDRWCDRGDRRRLTVQRSGRAAAACA